MIHELKCWKEYFKEIISGRKNFEIRKNDRDFQKGDTLILLEYDHIAKEYTGRSCHKYVTYILPGGGFGLEHGFVIMSI